MQATAKYLHPTWPLGLNRWLATKSIGYFQRAYAVAYYLWLTDQATCQPSPVRYYLTEAGATKIEQRVRREADR